MVVQWEDTESWCPPTVYSGSAPLRRRPSALALFDEPGQRFPGGILLRRSSSSRVGSGIGTPGANPCTLYKLHSNWPKSESNLIANSYKSDRIEAGLARGWGNHRNARPGHRGYCGPASNHGLHRRRGRLHWGRQNAFQLGELHRLRTGPIDTVYIGPGLRAPSGI